MFGKCKVCAEKDSRISDLKEELKHLRNILNPPARINRYEVEADNVLSGANVERISIDEESEQKENDRIQREQDLLFSTNTGGN